MERTRVARTTGIGGAMSEVTQQRMQWSLVSAMAMAVLALALGGCAKKSSATGPVPAAPVPAALVPAPPPTAGPQYRIQVGDELHVRFLYQPDMNEQIPVRPDGRISLATTGEIDVVGM